MDLLQSTNEGLYCPPGDFHIDPWRPVDFAVITHAHSDHARFGSRNYLTAAQGRAILQERLGPSARIDGSDWGASVIRNGVSISFHPAGHIPGSAQVRVEYRGEVWVASGDYKTAPDGVSTPFEPVKCNTFITESTFGLPIYRWRPQAELFAEINSWWRENQKQERTSVIFAYSLGKSQRLLANVDAAIGPIFVHGKVARMCAPYASAGIHLPQTQPVTRENVRAAAGRALVIAPSSVMGTPWLGQFGDISRASASGWMQIRGARRREALDRGFVISDHADWDGLLSAVRATGASRILVTHGYASQFSRYLAENGWDSAPLATPFSGETSETGDTTEAAE
jgi:putative mRNA 3-end processing factor